MSSHYQGVNLRHRILTLRRLMDTCSGGAFQEGYAVWPRRHALEVVPELVGNEVAVPRLVPASW